MREVHVLITGGTIDKVYDACTGAMVHHESSIERLLRKGRCSVPYITSTLFLKDSLLMTDTDRQSVFDAVKSINSEFVLITHGTDTMILTAKLLASITNKVIILVGSFIPSGLDDSDAEFNLGAAIAYSQVLPFGCYIAMNGSIYPYNHVEKDTVNQLFRWI